MSEHLTLTRRAARLVSSLVDDLDSLRGVRHAIAGGGKLLDLGTKAEGSIEAGLRLAEICLAGLGRVSLVAGELGGITWPHLQVSTDHPALACLGSQYAGWQLSAGKFFGMGSGPMRAVSAREEVFTKLGIRESADEAIGVIETGRLPDEAVVKIIAEKTGVAPERVTLLVARTASPAGNVQVVARSVETALHKLFELGFDVHRIRSGFGVAPLPPVAPDDLKGIGWTNDAILYGGRVTLWVTGDDESLAEIGARVPASASSAYGKPFLEIFEEAGRDFYKIDPHLFSPAEIVLINLQTGRIHRFGHTDPEILRRSFSLPS
jgi:methenyltetrahydromethanopterin cyclohydrolase